MSVYRYLKTSFCQQRFVSELYPTWNTYAKLYKTSPVFVREAEAGDEWYVKCSLLEAALCGEVKI